MTNGFAMHGVDHLSASSLNLWAAQPALWIAEKLLKRKVPVGAAAHRGVASEDGVAHGLFNPTAPLADCVAVALSTFDRLTALSGDPNRDKEREAIPGIVAEALVELREYGVPTPPPDAPSFTDEDGVVHERRTQHSVRVDLPGVAVPVIGYLDFVFAQHGIVVDLKSQLRLSSEISLAHARQGAVYAAGTNYEMRFCYATPKKRAVYQLAEPAAHLGTLQHFAVRLERFLRVSADPHELAGLLCPDFDSFYWSSPAARAVGRELFGF